MANQERYYQTAGATPLPLLEGLLQKVAAFIQRWFSDQHRVTRQVMVGAMLTLALMAFELFNYDTTEYALESLLGPISFAGVRWATILAIAFCSIDFAGLARLITPDTAKGKKGTAPDGRLLKPAWLLLGAWLLGGGMNAFMTWWAVSLALMGHDLGNEVLTREQLLRGVPIFVALLVWVTRILIISSFAITADQALAKGGRRPRKRTAKPATRSRRKTPAVPTGIPQPHPVPVGVASKPVFVGDGNQPSTTRPTRQPSPARPNGKPPRRPTVPRPPRGSRPSAVPLRMKGNSGGGRSKTV